MGIPEKPACFDRGYPQEKEGWGKGLSVPCVFKSYILLTLQKTLPSACAQMLNCSFLPKS